MIVYPDRAIERRLLSQLHQAAVGNPKTPQFLAGVDEVGRGALAGPASVGIALIDAHTSDEFPQGLRDSKMMTPKARAEIVPQVRQWVRAYAVGHAPASDVNRYGIIGALRAAAGRALEQLADFPIGMVLLDGVHDWWTSDELPIGPQLPAIPVVTQVKADAQCAVVAAASVLAKVARDNLMIEMASHYPGYDWERNKGYSSARHIAGLRELGPSAEHRTAWKLPS
ncbi:ribonuclease HII [Trueperella sp. LYQ143]|uniref:ribonuclease HII n=1 Tax=Trueperella sp. LYQ143 TaxID=3391059 RepID=UPI003983A4C4